MSDRTQDLKNLRAVATACKNYVDETKEQILWQVGQYDITTEDDNTTAYQKVVPTGATRCKIKRIYGLTQKLNPTTASDSTSYSVKTMPATVYDFDISKVDGNSEKSENLIVLSDEAETTTSGITYKVENGAITLLRGTATSSIKIATTSINVISGMSLSAFNDTSLTGLTIQLINNDVWVEDIYLNAINKTGTFANAGNSLNIGVANGTTISSPITIKPMLVSGSAAPTEFKQGFTGIHNFAWTGVKVEGSNLCNPSELIANHYTIKLDGTQNTTYASTRGITDYIEIDTTDYFISFAQTIDFVEFVYYDSNKNFISVDYSNNIVSFTHSIPSNAKYLRVGMQFSQSNVDITQASIDIYKPMLVRGSVAPTTFVPYIAPTTLPIDLSSILYNGSPLFEGNSLKAVGTAKDYITPYKAHKEVGSRAYQSGDEEDTSVLTDGTTTLYELTTPIEVSINWASLLRGITGYSNGTISLLNTNNQDTANLITYNSIIKENCCAKMVQSRGGNVIKTVSFSTQASDGYSAVSVANIRDFTTNKRGTNVRKVGLDTIDYTAQYGGFYGDASIDYQYNFALNTTKFICSGYTEFKYNNSLSDFFEQDNVITFSNARRFWINDSRYSGISASTFKTANDGVLLYYELTDASKTSTDITPIDNVLEVEPNDVLSFYNSDDELVTIPSDLTYRIEVAK